MKQILITLVEDKPGVLNRIASLFRRRNYNIDSLVVGKSEKPGVSRMTIMTNEEDQRKRGHIYFNLLNLVNVIAVKDVSNLGCVTREFILIKIQIGPDQLNEVNEVVKSHGARIVDMGKETVIIEATEREKEIDALVDELTPFNITEIMRTGKIAMRKGKTHKISSDKINAQADDVNWVPENIHTYHN
ncbi:MAG: acetolactate synthase small subunit [Candidatus Marinimicrobia bacterium]|nr:acetolactate synthase small subunit [Candidatus Neomarinimicrobiota bacterium]MBL7009600.1 acetolactate synthase small subunit [Candidatus Neomarinimicrobiota bacterium]MBL7029657.1 acetolactate synthase small subunit [Candidatus Neomarinimicrobiota bacterium]